MTSATAAGAMPLAEHLLEARRRAVRAAVALVVAAIIGYILSDNVLDVLRAPIAELAQSREASLNYDSITSAFNLRIRIALFAGVVLSSPVWLGELFGFLNPGLTRRERRYTLGFVAAALPLFFAGAFTGLTLFPHMVEVLASFGSDQDSTLLQASYYFDFVMKIVIATGLAFVLPAVIVVLNLLGVLPARSIAKSWRISVVVIVTFSALATPAADVLSMVLVALPMTGLFVTAWGIAWLHDRTAARRQLKALSDRPKELACSA
ncbi:twin-arginine translocase subunit TatC [Nesterenkonia muleiensis]|uniref:twin-arginine translocase subunit TatC n=1 Tax=Nesterenkonia muleiensis TaxID=2282648 RepID=UPI000E710D11|nr:twin-arginine translocase subunit TatC [Nesterenkonia muleiensis]